MPTIGLECYNENGTIRNTVTDYFGRILGTQEVSQNRVWVPWPYPSVPIARRVVFCTSNLSHVTNEPSLAFAYFDPIIGNGKESIFCGIAGDRLPITLLFMEF